MTSTFEQGWAAKPFKEQFPAMTDADAAHLDHLNHAITDMLMNDLLTYAQARDIRQKKFPRLVSRYVRRIKSQEAPA